jgi:ATPase family associated with various cellular activities (AAA)
MPELPIDDAKSLIQAIADLARMADRALPATATKLTQRVRDHLGHVDVVPNTSVALDPIERANVQLALDEVRETSAIWEEFGLAPDIGNWGGTFPSLIAGTWQGPGETGRQFISVAVSATETVSCLRAGIILCTSDDAPVAVMIYQTQRQREELVLEIAASTQEAADAFLERLRALMSRKNVLRGKVLTFAYSEYGGFGLTFTSVPSVARHDVILPDWQLDAIDEHAIGITDVRDALLASGQHLKRGLLLYGPPGTGKTHTVSYLIGQMSNRTTIILSGASVGAVGQAGTLARKLAPATIVIEDVDLIGMERGMDGGGHNVMLFQLLNEMDGLQPDDDVLFVLTTNRADLLEAALAARPGRIDQALEIGLPSADGRRALFRLYVKQPIESAAIEDAVERTEGAAAAYIKELARRATLRSLRRGESISVALTETIDEMHTTATPLLRSALAAPAQSGVAE